MGTNDQIPCSKGSESIENKSRQQTQTTARFRSTGQHPSRHRSNQHRGRRFQGQRRQGKSRDQKGPWKRKGAFL